MTHDPLLQKEICGIGNTIEGIALSKEWPKGSEMEKAKSFFGPKKHPSYWGKSFNLSKALKELNTKDALSDDEVTG